MSYIGNQPTNVAFLTDTFSGNGSTTAFTMSVAPANTSSILVAVTGVVQDPSTYSVSGTTLTFSAAPPSGTSNISVRYLGIPASGVTTTAYRTVTNFTATAGQTTFSTPSYTVGYIDVYRNGARLGSADYTATNGTTVILAAACNANDLVVTESFYVSSVLNAIPATAGAVNSTYITDAAVTQAKLASGVAGNGPAFNAYLAVAQSIPTATFTKVTFDTESFDTNGNFASSRFTPTVAGYYQINYYIGLFMTTGVLGAFMYKNGAAFSNSSYSSGSANIGGATWVVGSTIVYMNGSTDYVELYTYQSTGSSANTLTGQNSVCISGALVRAA